MKQIRNKLLIINSSSKSVSSNFLKISSSFIVFDDAKELNVDILSNSLKKIKSIEGLDYYLLFLRFF